MNNTKPKYDAIEHAKLVGEAISRMSSNHTKWLFTLFTIIGFSLTIDKFILELSGITKILAWSLISATILGLQIVALLTSQEYFKIENAYRAKQKRIFNGEFQSFDMNPDKTKKTRKWSWIIVVGWVVVFLYLIVQVTLILVNEFA